MRVTKIRLRKKFCKNQTHKNDPQKIQEYETHKNDPQKCFTKNERNDSQNHTHKNTMVESDEIWHICEPSVN